MTLTSSILDIAVQTSANIISNLAWFVLIYWGVKTIVKEMPKWLEQYEKMKLERRAIENALDGMRKLK